MKNVTEAQIAELLLMATRSPVNEGLKQLRKLMQPTKASEPKGGQVAHRLVLTNGTGRTERISEYAELERRSY